MLARRLVLERPFAAQSASANRAPCFLVVHIVRRSSPLMSIRAFPKKRIDCSEILVRQTFAASGLRDFAQHPDHRIALALTAPMPLLERRKRLFKNVAVRATELQMAC